MIYFDNAATTVWKPDSVAEAMLQALSSFGNAGRGSHDHALSAARTIYRTRALLSELFHGEGADCVAFCANATQALNTVIQGCLNPKDHVITDVMEHNSVLRPLYYMKKTHQIQLSVLGDAKEPFLTTEKVLAAVRPDTKLLICTHASNLTGDMNPIRDLGRLCREKGILFVVDASQTAGIFPIDMQEMMIDAVCFTGHKSLMGPQGTGGICLRRAVKLRPLLMGGSGIDSYQKEHPESMPTALEAGTLNAHGIAGLFAALSYIRQEGADKLRKKEMELMWEFYDQVRTIPGITIYGSFENREKERSPILSLNIRNMDSGYVSDILSEEYGILTRPGAHCAPLFHKILGTEKQGAVRFSFSHRNTADEIVQAVNALREISEA